ncbi:MAG: deacylase [Ignavibacteria bacterium CG2_30_36_16]|nr:YbaK/EbsC family protein [Ignavibacteria bacterium]OIP54780.1 MAG: deacylase [Ignavibacteria bacterium CG2_30_36_16]PJB01204.1 MAG: deacylase [Ignavibacteria bacterium CG_4_9_14_3_um_filter_36_18]
MPKKKLIEYLDENKVKYVVISHSPAFTAQEIAASAHIRGKELAKTVVIKIDGKMSIAVLPASYNIQFESLKAMLGAETVRLAYEQEFIDKFPDCEIGAMPPFGNLYNMDVFVAESLADTKEIAFNACSHDQLIKMDYSDFEKLVKPVRLKFTYHTML